MKNRIIKALWNTGANDDDDESLPSSKKSEKITPSVEIQPEVNSKGSSTKMRQYLAEVIEKANLPGFDYFEFKEAMSEIEQDVPDETTRMRTVFKTAKSMNVTAQTLVDAANHYIEVLGTEKQNFEAALTEKMNTEIGDQKKQLKDINKMITDSQKQIEELTKQIERGNSDAAKLSIEINAAESKVTKAQTDFITAFEETVGVIKSDIKKIKTILGVNK